MIVTFQPTINNTADFTACYMNFLRCATAIATAAAGTTSLTVNPFTSSNTIDTTKNCIISIDANTEAGGWTTSASHNVIASMSNTPAAYTSITSASVFLYKADFYNASGKSEYPYKKLCFHSHGINTAPYNPWSYPNSGAFNYSNIATNQGTNMLVTFGCSTTTDWTSNTFPPAGGGSGYINNGTQTTSWTLNGFSTLFSNLFNKPGLQYNDTSLQFHMAITADYCVIWESKVGDSYANGYFKTSQGTGVSGTNGSWDSVRYGSIFYMGLRENQPWETPLANNPPWVCWQHTQDPTANGVMGSTVYPANQVAAFMVTSNNSGVASATPKVFATVNNCKRDYFHRGRNSTVTDSATAPGYIYQYGSHQLDGPIFQTKAMFANTATYWDATAEPLVVESGNSTNMLYMPQYDTVTGMFVPGAWPIKISRSYTGEWNPGGACRGIFKSLSMPYATMQKYWQSASQTFTINGDPYLPFVLNEDMFLVRFA